MIKRILIFIIGLGIMALFFAFLVTLGLIVLKIIEHVTGGDNDVQSK